MSAEHDMFVAAVRIVPQQLLHFSDFVIALDLAFAQMVPSGFSSLVIGPLI
jgi:hypothetical protein